MTRLQILDGSTPLCQADGHSCAACCGLFNFADRSQLAMHERLLARTRAVTQAGWDAERLRVVRDELAAREDADLLFRAVRTCPFAGYLDDEQSRVGCMIHPLRHPGGEDLRDLGAYGDRNICAGHLCAPHTWLGPRERAVVHAAPSWRTYSMAIGESGFVHALLKWVANRRGGEPRVEQLLEPAAQRAAAAVLELFQQWPWADPDPRRFGGFSFAGDEAYERSAPSAAQYRDVVTPTEAIMLDCLGTLLPDETSAREAVNALRARLQELVDALP